jgi:hypothetical protein
MNRAPTKRQADAMSSRPYLGHKKAARVGGFCYVVTRSRPYLWKGAKRSFALRTRGGG